MSSNPRFRVYVTLHACLRRPLARGAAIALALLQTASTGPVLWAGRVEFQHFRIVNVPTAGLQPVAPDPELLALQASLITGQQNQDGDENNDNAAPLTQVLEEALPAEPTDRELSSLGFLPVRLSPVGRTTLETNSAVAKLLQDYGRAALGDRRGVLAQFVEQNADSPWRAAVLASLGRMEAEKGFFSRAAGHLAEAWQLATERDVLEQKQLASEIMGDLALVLARTRRDDEFRALLEKVEKGPQYGVSRQKLVIARSTFNQRNKGIASFNGGCATASLRAWHWKTHAKEPLPAILTDVAERQRRGLDPRANEPSTLAQIAALANLAGYKAQAMQFTGDTPLPLPAILHWKHGHFGLAVARNDREVLVEDPLIGGTAMFSVEALREECSGYALFLGTDMHAGWKALAESEAAAVTGFTGSGLTPETDDAACEAECKSCGMPSYWFKEAEGTLRINDTPLWDDPGVGTPIEVTLKYADRQFAWLPGIDATGPYVGRMWSLNLLSAVGGFETVWDGSGAPYTYYESATVYLPGGGKEEYSATGEANEMGNAQLIARAFRTHALLEEIVVNDVTVGYTRTTSDGTRYDYTLDASFERTGVHGGPYFLARITDPNGLQTNYSYSPNPLRLTGITGPSGNGLVFEYNSPQDSLWLTRIYSTTRGATNDAVFTYNAVGQLVTIKDMMGLQSTFTYASGSDFINTMTTPYGRSIFSGSAYDPEAIWLEAVDPLGGRERLEVVMNGTNIADVDPVPPSGNLIGVKNAELNARNSYHWHKKAMHEIGDGTLDRNLAHITHWLVNPVTGRLGPIPHSSKAPLEARVWYEYPEQDLLTNFYGTFSEAKKVARVLDDGTTQMREFQHNDAGNVIKTIDPIGRTTLYGYSGLNLSEIRQKNGANEELLAKYELFTAGNRPQKVTDAAGQVTNYTYNSDGKVLTAKRTRGGVEETMTYIYYSPTDPVGSRRQLHYVQAPTGQTILSLTYDGFGRVSSATDADNFTVSTTYDVFDRALTRTYPDGTSEQTVYNRLDPEWHRDREGRWSHTEHDAQRQVVAVTDSAGRRTQFEWCVCGSLENIVDAKGQITSFMRDVQSRVTDKIYMDGSTLHYDYEARTSRLKAMRQPRSATFTAVSNYEYYVDGTLKKLSYTDGNGVSLFQTRADGTKIDAPVEWTYSDVYKRVTTMTLGGIGQPGAEVTVYGYHPIVPTDGFLGDGRLASVDGPLGSDTITYVYDEYGRIKQRSVNGSATTLTFDNLGRVGTEANPLGTFTYTYAPNTNRLTEVSNGSGFRTVYEYYPSVPSPSGSGDGDFRLKAIKHYRSTTTLDADHAYHYPKSGNINQWTQRYNGLAEGTDYTLRYDSADQLVGADRRDLASVLQNEQAWSYDAAGNRELAQTSARQTGGNYLVELTRATHNALNQLTARTGGTGAMRFEGTVNEPATLTVNGVRAGMRPSAGGTYRWSADANLAPNGSNTIIATDARGNSTTKTAVVTATGTAIPTLTYDLAGNLLSDGSRTYEWDAANRLVRIAYAGQTTSTEFTYDGLGRRSRIVEKNNATVLSTQLYVWDGLTIAEERSAANAVTKRFYRQGEQQGGTTLLYRRDHLGSIRETTDASGTMNVRIDYDLWGKRTLLTGGGNPQPTFGYTGHYYHANSGLHFAPYRAYSADLARWLSRDPIAESGGLNLYGYVFNNPVAYVDPDGLLLWAIAGTAAGALIGGAISAYKGGSFWRGALSGAVTGALMSTGLGAAGALGVSSLGGWAGAGAASGFLANTAGALVGGSSLTESLSAGVVGAATGALLGPAAGAARGIPPTSPAAAAAKIAELTMPVNEASLAGVLDEDGFPPFCEDDKKDKDKDGTPDVDDLFPDDPARQ